MKTLIFYKKLTLLFIFLGFATAVLAQDTWTEGTAAAWLSKKEWKNGLKLDVHSSVNKVVFAEQYHKNQAM